MKYFYKLNVIFFFLLMSIKPLFSNDKIVFIDVDYLIKNSHIGKTVLKNINDLNIENINKLEKKNKSLKELESTIKNKKNIISENEFNSEVEDFQQKVKEYNKDKDQLVKEFNNFRKEELEKLFKLFNPIISEYMKQNSVNILMDSKNIFMGSADSNVTENLLEIINKEIK